MLLRSIQESIESRMFKGRAVIIYGPRRVGKTTLIREIQKKYKDDSLYLNCDEPDIRAALTDTTSTQLGNLAGSKKVVFIDEAQRVKNIGLTLKLFVDTFPEIQVAATGSSSLDLSNEIKEPLTGRKYEFHLFPFSLSELTQKYSDSEITRLLERWLITGMYPDIINQPESAQVHLKELADSYLYKDILQYQDIRKPEVLEKLLVSLSLQIGNEVSYNELASSLGVSKKTVAHYIDLLEKSFIIFRLGPFSRNLRSELTKMRKIYFYDTGIRNALILNFNALDIRQDTGVLWENFLISERIKYTANSGIMCNSYFWRTHQQQEIDYLEETQEGLHGFEIKWQKKGREKAPKAFLESYPESSVGFIDRSNFLEFTRRGEEKIKGALI